MFDSLKEWMTCSFQVQHFEGYNAAADRQFSEPINMLGYYVGNIETITDALGNEVVSSSQIYYDPSKYTIESLDKITVDGIEKDVIQITNYMDGNFGTTSIKIVYL